MKQKGITNSNPKKVLENITIQQSHTKRIGPEEGLRGTKQVIMEPKSKTKRRVGTRKTMLGSRH